MTHTEYMAVKRFAEGLKGCFNSKMGDSTLLGDILKYVNDAIDLHLQLAEREFNQQTIEEEAYYGKTKI